jgi:hypothetical protein
LKTLFFTCLALLWFCPKMNADTLDFWHVYYNDVKIHEFNVLSKGKVVLKSSKIKSSDSLTVKYFKDMRCSSCETYLSFENNESKALVSTKGRGTFNPVKMSLLELQQHFKTEGLKTCNVYYVEKQKGKENRRFIFPLMLE